MAHVGHHQSGDAERGQLILVTGLVIAVTMVALVLLLNTAIYTENLASRGTDQSGREAVEYRATMVQSVQGLIVAEHDRDHETHASLWENVSDGIGRIDNLTARSYAVGATVVQVEDAVEIHNGTVINQSTEGEFESANNDAHWTLVEDVRGVRSFTMTVDPAVSTNQTRAVDDDAFNVSVDDGSTRRQYYVYENDSSVEVAVRTDDGDADVIYDSSSNEIEIDFVDNTIDGDDVSELDWSDDLSTPYQIEFGNGSAATGTYVLTVNSSSVDQANFEGEPGFEPIVYRVDLPLRYETPALTYRTTVRIFPGGTE